MSCAGCAAFQRDGIEAGLPGLAALGSAHASTRADDGLCRHHDRYVTGSSGCQEARPSGGPGRNGGCRDSGFPPLFSKTLLSA